MEIDIILSGKELANSFPNEINAITGGLSSMCGPFYSINGIVDVIITDNTPFNEINGTLVATAKQGEILTGDGIVAASFVRAPTSQAPSGAFTASTYRSYGAVLSDAKYSIEFNEPIIKFKYG